MAVSKNHFELLAGLPLKDMCVELPPWFHVPLQQLALRSLLAPERNLQMHEHTMWLEQTILAYVLGQRAEAQAGVPRFLPPALLAALNRPEGPEEDLPLTAFFAMLCRRMRPYDRSADVRSRAGRLRFYLDLLVVQNIGLRLPPALVPDFIWRALQAPAGADLSHALAHFWRKLFPQIPFTPQDAAVRSRFLQEAVRAVQQLRLDVRLVPFAGLAPFPVSDVLAAPSAPPASLRQDMVNLLLWDVPSNSAAPLAAPMEAALKASGLSFKTFRLPSREAVGSYEGATNILLIHPEALGDGLLAHGLPALQGRKNILYAFWETGRLSDAVRAALPLADEIWVPSRAQQELFAAAASAPVQVVPLPVVAAAPAPHITRGFLGLPEDTFVFLAVVDGPDSFARKNIQGACEAFQHAFQGQENVFFLVKSRNFGRALAPREEGAWARLKRRMAEDARILHIHEDFSPAEMAGLYAQADCFVALHRASPFSASALEAALSGLPLVASATGRVHEVVAPERATFVPVQTCSVVFDVTPALDKETGHIWHDPDVAQASAALRVAYEKGRTAHHPDSALAESLSARASGAVLQKGLRA